MLTKVLIYGAGGHARVVADVLRAAEIYEVVGFIDDIKPERRGEAFAGSTVLGGREQLPGLRESGVAFGIVAIGACTARLQTAEMLLAVGLKLSTAVHPRSTVAPGVMIGEGTVIVAGAVINPGAVIGRNVIVNTCASVDHECIIEDGVHICPGVRLAGGVTVGRGAWVGIGAVVLAKVNIGAGAVIGAGSVVLRDVPAGTTVYGVPARIAKKG